MDPGDPINGRAGACQKEQRRNPFSLHAEILREGIRCADGRPPLADRVMLTYFLRVSNMDHFVRIDTTQAEIDGDLARNCFY